jgi:hypothetical protein
MRTRAIAAVCAAAAIGWAGARAPSADAAELAVPVIADAERCSQGPGPIEILAADVVIAIDRSASTRTPTGMDLDGNGLIGDFRDSDYTDPSDSLLAAQLAAVARLVEVARLGGMRFAIVSWSGRGEFPLDDNPKPWVDRRDARLEVALTDDYEALEAAVARVARRGSEGSSSFAPAMRLALRSFERNPSSRERRQRVLFLSDSPGPTRYAPMSRIARDDPRMLLEARRALESGVPFYSFGIGEAAQTEPAHALSQIAGATGGTYRPVSDPRNLYCQMLAALGESDPR